MSLAARIVVGSTIGLTIAAALIYVLVWATA